MQTISMSPEARNVTCDPDCIFLQCPTDPDLQLLLVFATDSLPMHSGTYDRASKMAWLNTDSNQFTHLTAIAHQNIDIQIDIDGKYACNLDFSRK